MSSYLLELANNKKYTTAIVHTRKSNWNRDSIDVSKITRLEVINNGKSKYVTDRLVIKEPSNAVSISTILDIPISKLRICSTHAIMYSEKYTYIKIYCPEWFERQSKYCVILWDPWMMDSLNTTSSVLGKRKRSIPADLINMIQDFTHIKDQHID